ncbi:MAG: hypothetical protein WAS33_10745, partial [Candidatus Promineifilaceae bacterium]
VNGDTVGDDSLAELDDLTSGDLVATLAKIITGDVQIEAHSLQQAFAEANASLRQANTIIGDYQMVEEEPEEEAAVEFNGNGHVNGDGQRPLLAPDHLIVINGHNGRSAQQPSLFTNGHGQAKLNGRSSSPEPTADQAAETQPGKGTPKPPRPRLFALPSPV